MQLQSQLPVPTLTLRSFKQLELSTTNNVRSAQPMRFIAGLGDCQTERERDMESVG